MSDKKEDKDALKEIGTLTTGMISSAIANLVFIFAVVMIIRWVGFPIADYIYGEDNRPEWIGKAVFALLLALIFSNPYEAWKHNNINYRFFGKFGLGLILGIGLLKVDFGALDASDNIAGEKSDLSWYPWLAIALPLLMMPILFGTHALERFVKNKNAPLMDRLGDAAVEYVNTSGPVIMMAVMGICAFFYWVVSLPLTLLIIFLTTIAIGIIAYCTFLYDGTEEPVTDDTYVAARSASLSEALTVALDVSVKLLPGMMFTTGLIWVAMAFWNFSSVDFGNEGYFNALGLIWTVIKAGIIAIVVMLGGTLLAHVAGAMSIALWAQFKGMDYREAEMRADKFNEMLYGGAMGKLFHGTLEKHD